MRIALVKLSSLGDVVHALPVASALRARLPRARLAWVVERREAALLRGHPALDEVIPVDSRAWRRTLAPRALLRPLAAAHAGGELAEMVRHLRAARFDVAVDLQGLLKSGALTALTGAPLRIGFAAARCREPLAALFTNLRLTPPPSARHVVEQNLALVAPLGVAGGSVEFALPSDAAAEARADAFLTAADLKPGARLVVLNPGAGRADKRWPPARFRELATRLTATGVAALVVWGPSEEALARAIADGAGPRIVLAPPTDLHGLLALLRRASLVVAGDTGPLHLAAALGVPCVGLYGPTSAERNGPWGQRALMSPDGRLASLDADRVLGAVAETLDR